MTDRQELLYNMAPCGVITISENGIITNANAYCCKVLEFDPNDLVGTNIFELLSIAGRIFYQTHLYPLVKLHHHANEIFLTLQTRNKKDLPVVVNAISVTLQDVPSIICSFIPVNNRRKYEDEILLAKNKAEQALEKNEELERVKLELEIQQKALDKQIGLLKFQNKELIKLGDVIAHDLQEPVRKLIFFSNELIRKDGSAAFNDNALLVLKNSAQKIKSLLLNLQNYLTLTVQSKINEQVNLKNAFEYELQQLTKTHKQVKVNITIDDMATVKGNKNQLNWLLHHILKNAFEHGSVDQVLTLNIQSVIIKENLYNMLSNKYKYVDYVKIMITDSGPGFDPLYNDYIFDVLKRLDAKGEKLGFGLAFCKRIAENHYGRLLAEGNPGKGATFTLILPIDHSA